MLFPVAVSAYPDGAPWEELNDQENSCVSCHQGSLLVTDSDAFALLGGVDRFVPGVTYSMKLRFAPRQAKAAGFVAGFYHADGESGSVSPGTGLEAKGSAFRSVSPASLAGGSCVAWTFDWTAPVTPGQVKLRIAANAANDDASPLGDIVHTKTLVLIVGQESE